MPVTPYPQFKALATVKDCFVIGKTYRAIDIQRDNNKTITQLVLIDEHDLEHIIVKNLNNFERI